MTSVEPRTFILKKGSEVVVREAEPGDAKKLIDFINFVAGESDYLSFGAGQCHLQTGFCKIKDSTSLRKSNIHAYRYYREVVVTH